MLKISPVTNVNSTLSQPMFRARVQTNYGVQTTQSKNPAENNLFSAFAGAIENLIHPKKVKARAEKIQSGLESTEQKIDAIA